MKILQICSASSIGGGERHLADLCRSLGDRGHDVFAAIRPGSPVRSMLSSVKDDNLIEAGLLNAADVLSSSFLSGFIKEKKVDLIHAHIARDYPIAAIASKLSGRPYVLTRHVLFPLKRLHRYLLKGVGAVITPSSAVFESLLNEGIFPSGSISLVHNGIDTNRFAPTQRPIVNTNLLFGSIGQLGNIKGHDIFIKAANIVAEQNASIRFRLVGEDTSRNGRDRKFLTKLLSEYDIESKFELRGWADDVREHLTNIDIFVSAARSESFGLSIAEAMASGIPVIATSTEGAAEVIVDGASGILVPSEDPDALAAAMIRMALDEHLRDQLAKEGRERILQHFSLDQMIDKTEAIYRKVINAATLPQR